MADRYWVGGTGTWDATTTHWSATSGGAAGASVPTLSDDVFFNSASNATGYTVTKTAATAVKSINIAAPATGTLTFSNTAVLSTYGDVTVAGSGVSLTGTNGTISFVAPSGTATFNLLTNNNPNFGWLIRSAGTSPASHVINLLSSFTTTVNPQSATAAWDLSGTSSAVGSTVTVNLNGYTLTTPSMRINSSFNFIYNFGSAGAVYLTGYNGTFSLSLGAWGNNTFATKTYTGSKNFYFVGNAPRNVYTFLNTSTATITAAQCPNLTFSHTGTIPANGGGGPAQFENIDLSGSTAVNWNASSINTTSTNPNNSHYIFGNVTLSSSLPQAISFNGSNAAENAARNMYFSGSSTQTISCGSGGLVANGTLNRFIKNTSNTLQLIGASSLRTVTGGYFDVQAGTLDLNGYTLTFSPTTGTNTFRSTGLIPRTIAFGSGGSLVITSSGADAFFTTPAIGSPLTTTGTGTISLTSASAKTFAGGGYSYPTINQGGAGVLIITGANTFADITNTVQPATITMPASTTNTFSDFSLTGTVGNLVTLNSSSPGLQATISKSSGTIDVYYMSIQDSNATGATWNANSSTNVSNNTGWKFPVGATGNFFSVF